MNPDYKTYSDQLLFGRLSNDDQDAFQEIYQRHSPQIFRTAYNILREKTQAEDVVQEIFLTLWRCRQTLETKSLGAYLNQSAWYFAIKVQKQQRKNADFYSRLTEISTEIWKEDPVLFKEFQSILEKTIADLPEDELEMLRFSREQNMTHGEIARHLNIHQKKVERKISQSLKRIKMQLGNWLLFLLLLLILV